MDDKPSNTAEPHSATELDAEKAITPPKNEAEDEFPSGVKVLVIMSAVWLSMFLVALVCTPCQQQQFILMNVSGSNNPRNSHPKNHR